MKSQPERLIVDRIEKCYAICENEAKEMVVLKLENLPEGVKEGDCLILNDDEFLVDKLESQNRRRVIEEKINHLFVD
jgi:S-adenosylmethionine:tRNA-ribosyltransferase-isomerase (queuine synthetase)